MSDRPIIVASNRGPSLSFDVSGRRALKSPVGGLASLLTGALERAGGVWIASAMSDDERRQASEGPLTLEGESAFSVRFLAFDEQVFSDYYITVSNRILWYLHHYLWNLPRDPVFDVGLTSAWSSYRTVNEAFARAVVDHAEADPEGTPFLVQDYHLSLVPSLLRRERPEGRVAHFTHTPFTGPTHLRVLPPPMREELLRGLLGADLLGFHTDDWADNFLLCCRAFLDVEVDLDRRRVRTGGREVRVGAYPASPDAEALVAELESSAVQEAVRRIEASTAGCKLVLAVARTELSKNILRGLQAFRMLLRNAREWRRGVRFMLRLMPSRSDVEEYEAYVNDCLRLSEEINDEFGDERWSPVDLSIEDDHASVVAAYSLYDVLLVNPIFDGMNLVAKEGPVVNRRDGVLILSENSGASKELDAWALGVNPFDLQETERALATALAMPLEERARRQRALREAVLGNRPEAWVERQLADLEALVD